jgi:hypothetical protein
VVSINFLPSAYCLPALAAISSCPSGASLLGKTSADFPTWAIYGHVADCPLPSFRSLTVVARKTIPGRARQQAVQSLTKPE